MENIHKPLTTIEKLVILGESAKYDVSCSSSGSKRASKKGSMGSGARMGICHTFASDGRCVSLLKILLTNYCIYDCAYCINRRSNDIRRAAFEPEELAKLVMDFYRRNYIEGLFISSGVVKNPDHTMELMIRTCRILRETEGFNGYIHLKAIPGASKQVVDMAGSLVDRMSVNLELPSEGSLRLLAPEKSKDSIFTPIERIHKGIGESLILKKEGKKGADFVPAGQSTQLIVGASPEDDRKILKLSDYMYSKYRMRRVYYSAYIKVNEDSRLPMVGEAPLLRENRLYQADWLMRFYGFSADEILDEDDPFFDLNLDPKAAWALRHLDKFPVDVNTACYEQLLRVPGIGVRSAKKLLKARAVGAVREEDLKKLGVVVKRAKYFITVGGVYAGRCGFKKSVITQALLPPPREDLQLNLFDPKEEFIKTVGGEL